MSEFKAKTIAEISAHCINFDYALQNEYNKLLQAYTTTRAELDTVKAELDRGKWISVSERLPEINIDVLGFLNDRYIRHEIEIVRLTEAGKFYKPFKEIEITHWQPLPTPPHKN